jgi:hypothetical protein
MMMMTIGGLAFATVVLIISFLTGSRWLQNFVLGSVGIWLISYFLILLFVSLFSTEQTLAMGEAKQYCGFYLDCHLHTAVTNIRRAKTIGGITASGQFYVVRVKVFSDAKRATLGLLAVDAKVVDADNRRYARDLEAETQVGEQPPFDRKISPAESFEKEIVFDLPENVLGPRLDIKEGYGIDHVIEAVLIDDEDSIFHKRNFFELAVSNVQTVTAGQFPEQTDAASVNKVK